MIKLSVKVTLALCLIACLAAVSSAATVDEIVGAVEKRGASIKDMSCTVRMDMNVMQQAMAVEGEMKMMSPDKLRYEVTMRTGVGEKATTAKIKLVSDGTVMHQEMTVEGRVVAVNKVRLVDAGASIREMPLLIPSWGAAPGQAGSMVSELSGTMDLKVLPDDTLAGGQKAWVIEGKMKPEYFRSAQGKAAGADPEVLRWQEGGVRIFVGQTDRIINRMVFLSGDGKETGSIVFENVKFDSGLKAEDFAYAPPADVTVNDLTERVKENREAAKLSAAKAQAEAGQTPAAGSDAPPCMVLKAGTQAPAFAVKTLNGGAFELAKSKGKPVVVYFWATWQKDSVAKLGELNDLVKAEPRVAVILLSIDDARSADAVKKLLTEKGMTLPAALADADITNPYNVRKVPTYLLLDAEGKVVASDSEPKDLSPLKKALESILKK